MTHTLCEFHHHFIDWLCLDNPYKNLRNELKLSRLELGKLLDTSPHTIRRYETENKAPKIYLIMLRVLCGDLSIYGARWADCRIQPHDRKLKNPYSQTPLYPVELNAMYNNHAHNARTETAKERIRADKLEKELEAVKKLNIELIARIELKDQELTRLKAEKAGIKKGVVIPLFK
jgi:DNA-binding XRE family transcriptional regulator